MCVTINLKKKKFYAGLKASSCPEIKRSPKKKKKRSSLVLGVFLSQKCKNGSGYKSQGGKKSPRGGRNISRGGSCPPSSPTSCAYAN